jgi:hypothetical protein
MLNDGGSPTVTDCVFTGNVAKAGAGMANAGGSPTVTNCTFSLNCTVTGAGGGMANVDSNATVTNCDFTENCAVFAGGGMFNAGNVPHLVRVVGCTFSGNSADSAFGGGGMFNGDSSPAVTNCSFTGNSAINGRGGGLSNAGSSPTITNCNFNANTADVGGAVGEIPAGGSPSNPMLRSCVLWGDSPDEIFEEAGSQATVSYSVVQGGFAGVGNSSADPKFVDPVNGDVRLQPGSPCIDAADNTAVPAGTTTDLDGAPRFVDDPDSPDRGNGGPPVVDMGAYEFQPATTCPWDCESVPDGTVGINDFLALLAGWGPCP